ncbi:related to NNF2 Protein with role in chromosome segregation [Rhynchosporium secalis]|uniref:Related to NNF2 Protein with role in chromosome segregation n=1 Tax=Rhynchosporium secalis TaxID=38038 RepID=A0A1E1MJP9_RHYSE|nr:related to NNF2 Protein with role in chromosome segregation [Rhynchosporium secalis]
MPRGPATSKRQPGAANQRDTRHENGLVGPGKKVQKQKSNGQLNDHAKPTESNSSTPPLPGTPPPSSNGHARRPMPGGENMAENKMVAGLSRKASVDGSSDSASDVYQNASGAPPAVEHRQINVNAAKNPLVHHDALSFALTVLWACPLWDTLAILIVLLQIPPTFLSIVHLLFATLTFVPPSTAANSSGLSFTDILQGTLGTPSVGTIFLIDVLVLMVWLFLWSPLQDIALDLAQTVIALTLGGGTSGKGAGMKNVVWCFSVIGLSHYFHGNTIQSFGLRAIMASNGFIASPDPDDPLEPHSGNSSKRHGLIRSILAIHILTQGVVRYIRDWYVRREKRDSSASIADPEAGKALDAGSDSTTTPQTQENDSPASLTVGIPIATIKKKKKQSAQVRSRQPLWAALASTKIVMVKEYETSHTASESAGTNATGANDLGNAPFQSEADRIWVTSIGSDEVAFSTSYFPVHKRQERSEENTGLDPTGIDMTKPFYVKVNNTTWQPTRINSTAESEQTQGDQVRWSGVIVGLAPTSSYQCDFYSTSDDSLIFSGRVRTLQSSTADLSVGLSPGPHTAGRPGSPTSTLRTSIGTQELKLQEEKRTLKSNRKDQKSKLALVRKEIDRFAAAVQSTGPNDEKQKQKIHQSNLNRTQAEERTQELESEIASFQAVPTDDTARYSSAKSEIQSQRDKHKLARSEFNTAKAAAEREIEERKNELHALKHKSDTKKAKLSLLNEKHEELTDANAKGLDEAERKEREREAKRKNREDIHEFYINRDQHLNLQIQEGTSALNAVAHAIETLRGLHRQDMYQADQSPDASNQNLSTGFPPDAIPENGGMNASAYPWNPPSSSAFSSGTTSSDLTVTAGPNYSPHGVRTRGRTSSMLSNVSGFTQSSSEGPSGAGAFYPGIGRHTMWSDAREERKESSASGSASGSGSLSDPKSPTARNLGAASRW